MEVKEMARLKRYPRVIGIMVSEEVYEILSKQSLKQKKTMSEFIREILEREIERQGWDKEQEQSPATTLEVEP